MSAELDQLHRISERQQVAIPDEEVTPKEPKGKKTPIQSFMGDLSKELERYQNHPALDLSQRISGQTREATIQAAAAILACIENTSFSEKDYPALIKAIHMSKVLFAIGIELAEHFISHEHYDAPRPDYMNGETFKGQRQKLIAELGRDLNPANLLINPQGSKLSIGSADYVESAAALLTCSPVNPKKEDRADLLMAVLSCPVAFSLGKQLGIISYLTPGTQVGDLIVEMAKDRDIRPLRHSRPDAVGNNVFEVRPDGHHTQNLSYGIAEQLRR